MVRTILQQQYLYRFCRFELLSCGSLRVLFFPLIVFDKSISSGGIGKI
jgi:hypothetical protein